MTISATAKRRAGIMALACAIAMPAEGLRQVAYYDPPGILTVCYGHTSSAIDKFKRYSLAECEAFLSKDMGEAIDTVERCLPGLPPHITAAVADAVFNLGPNVACNPRTSTPHRMLKAGEVEKGCDALKMYDKARIAGQLVALPGLTKRRHKEALLCKSGVMPTDAQVAASVAADKK
jgi:lysozyme